MADTKITALAAIGANPINVATFPIPMVDLLDNSMAASGTTKKVTVNQILGAGGTATLASATITGDLTVDTSTLKVDSANNRVGIGTATPAETLHVSGGNIRMSINQFLYLYYGSATNYASLGADNSGNVQVFTGLSSPANRFQIANDGVCTWSNVGGVAGTAMTLNSTGLGVGMSPQYKLQVGSTTYSSIGLNIASVTDTACIFKGTPDAVGYEYAKIVSGRESSPFTYGSFLAFYTEGKNSGTTDTSIERLRIDSTGNVGIGVTPSAWNSDFRALQVSGSGSYLTSYISGATVNQWLFIGNNAFYDTVDSRWEYIRSKPSAQYIQYNNEHQWLRDTGTQTAGAACSFTQAMTLDASGNLLVGKTASSSTAVGAELRPSGAIISTLAASTNADFALYTYSTGAGAARFYVGMSGTVFATNTTISAISDQRLKENVQDIDVGLGAILALKPRKFDWKTGKGKDIKGDRGFIAQEFETVFPQLVDEWADPAPEGEAPYKSVRQDLIPVLVKAIQELTARVQTLEAK